MKAVFFFCLLLFITNFSVCQVVISDSKLSNDHRFGFIENKGQIIDQNNKPNPSVLYLLNTQGMNVQLRRGGFSYDLFRISNIEQRKLNSEGLRSASPVFCQDSPVVNFHRIDFDLIGSNPDCEIKTSGRFEDYLNYYTTGTPDFGATIVRSYQTVIYRNIYPNVDLEFFSDPKTGVKYNFVVHPGGKLSSIQMKITDPEIGISSTGTLQIKNTIGTIEEQIPQSYYQSGQSKTGIDIKFIKLRERIYGFSTNQVTPHQSTLVIDPYPIRLWGTYYGGTGGTDNFSKCVLDNSGNVICTGGTESPNNIASAGAYQTTFGGQIDALLVKFDNDGQRLWGTYYGSNARDYGNSCCLDKAGNIYLVGETHSLTNIATPGAHQRNRDFPPDGFLVKFNTNGQRIWGTYYGGDQPDMAYDCVTDDSCNVYMVGWAVSTTNISSPGAFQTVNGGSQDAFMVKFDSSGQRKWGTYFGGEDYDQGWACAIDSLDRIYLAGAARSINNVASPGAWQTVHGGGDYDAFLAAFNFNGQRLWSTYYGGDSTDTFQGCAVDKYRNIFLSGYTSSTNGIASPGAFKTTKLGIFYDAMAVKFDSSGVRIWGTYYGDSGVDYAFGCAVDDSCNLFFTGYTNSANGIATPNGFQTVYNGGSIWDSYLAKFNKNGQRRWGTYYGGIASDAGKTCALDRQHHLFHGGSTSSLNNMTTPGGFQPAYGGGLADAYLGNFCILPDSAVPINGPVNVCKGTAGIVYTVPLIDYTLGYIWHTPPGTILVSGQGTHSISVDYPAGALSGNVSVYGYNVCGIGDSAYIPISVHDRPIPVITGNSTPCAGSVITYTTQSGMAPYVWTLSAGGTLNAGGTASDPFITIIWSTPGPQWVRVNYFDDCSALTPSQFDVLVTASPVAMVTISPSANPVCTATAVTFTAIPLNGGNSPSYQWKVNGVDAGGNFSVFTYMPLNGDVITCILTSGLVCVTGNPATSNSITMAVNANLVAGVSIAASANPVCSSTLVNFTATSVNQGFSPLYQWKVNGINGGANSSSYGFIPADGDIVDCMVTSSISSCITNNPANSNIITMVVNPNIPVSLSILPSENPVCNESMVTFTGTPLNPGTSPVYEWKVNGVNVGINSSSYSYIPSNGDQVNCELTSSWATCVTNNPAVSNTIAMTVNPIRAVSVSISASANTICSGVSVAFTASPFNGGASPDFQWKVNNMNVGSNTSIYTYFPVDGDVVNCILTSSLSNCTLNNPAVSNSITMLIGQSPNITFSACFDTITTVNAKPFKLKGGLPLGGNYSGLGVNSSTGIFTPSLAGIGVKTINYSYFNIHDCIASKSKSIVVQPNPAFTCGNNFTDIRDGKSYPTVQIGTQCWMSANLNYGSNLNSSQVQNDNCLSEKYCFNDLAGNCTKYGGLYQWDEVMKNDDTPAGQGLCPPGWHVPTEVEWTTLLNFYLGSVFAGKPLQDTILAGFRAQTSGVFYLNSNWSFNGFATLFWTSTPWNAVKAISHGMNVYDFSVSLYPSSRANAFPVRCLRD